MSLKLLCSIWRSASTRETFISSAPWTTQLCSHSAPRSWLKKSSQIELLCKLPRIGGKVPNSSNTSTVRKRWANISPVWTDTWTSPLLTCTSTIASGSSSLVLQFTNFCSTSISVWALTSNSGDPASSANSLVRPLRVLELQFILLVERWIQMRGRDFTTRRKWTCLTTLWSDSNTTTLCGLRNYFHSVTRLVLLAALPSQRNVSTSTNWTGSFRVLIFSSLNSKRSSLTRRMKFSLTK